MLVARLLLLDSLREQTRIEVEAHGRHVAGLLRAKDVAGTADLEVRQRDLEARTEFRRVEDRLEALAGLVRQALSAAVEQVGVGPAARSSDAAPQLVQLCEAER